MLNIEIDFFAFFFSGVLAFGLGIIWYHPKVLGKTWMESRGQQTPPKPSPLPFAASFFLWLLAAGFYSFLAYFLGVESWGGYFCLSCLLWVAFSMPPSLMGSLYTGYPFEAMAIDTSYQLGGYYIFALVHTAVLMMG